MKVFSTYWKIIKTNAVSISIYICVFIGIVIIQCRPEAAAVVNLEGSKIPVSYINDDAQNPFTDGLIAYLGKNLNLKDITGSRENAKDALFFRRAEYVLEIPKGFGEGFAAENRKELKKEVIENSYSNVYVDLLVNKYLHAYELYRNHNSGLTDSQIAERVSADLSIETKVEFANGTSQNENSAKYAAFLNIASYALFSTVCIGMGVVMSTFQRLEIRKRNLCSPIKEMTLNRRILLCNLSFALAVCLTIMVVEAAMFKEQMFTQIGFYLNLNLLIFTGVAVGFGMLIAYSVTANTAQIAVVNLLGLGMAFLGGAFAPQELLGDKVNAAASFLPVHWFVKLNDMLCKAGEVTSSHLKEIYYCYGIQIGFAVALLSVAFLIAKQKRFVKSFD